MIKSNVFIFLLVFVFFSVEVSANVRLPQLISNHMVLQRDVPLKIWGWADPGENVMVSFNGKRKSVVTAPDGKWIMALPAMKAGGPYTMTIRGKNTITITDILMGDVWFCAGQSNMVLALERLKENYPEVVKNDDFPQIRNFFVATKADVTKVNPDLPKGQWKTATGQNLLEFGGVTYFFAKQLYQKYKVPIGIINSSVGGTPIEAWMSEEAFSGFPDAQAQIKTFKDTTLLKRMDNRPTAPSFKSSTSYVPNTVHKFWMPGYWADQGVKNLNGVLFFKKEIEVPASMVGVPARLFLGRIIDSDSTFVNGKFVGNITYQYPPRRYTIPADLLKVGKNTILVKVTSTNGKGGFVPEKNYTLQANNQSIDLRGDWTYQVVEVFPRTVYQPQSQQPIVAQSSPTGLYNTMVAPVIQYQIKGFLWYQGETNAGKSREYGRLLSSLISDWRVKWQQGNLPFLFAQLPNYMEVSYLPGESDWAQMRQAQLETLALPNTGMAVGLGAGEWNDIHPLNKKDIGERLALWAEHLAYGEKNKVYSGPIYRSAVANGSKVTLSFDHVGGGLVAKGEPQLYYFAIAGADRKFLWAKANIEANKVVVWNDAISNPMYVRYAWADNPEGANLYNVEGLPASPFEAVIK